MSDLDRALAEISAIRGQLARAVDTRLYGPATFAATGAAAAGAALAQHLWVHDPATHLAAWLGLWLATAAISAAIISVEMLNRSKRIHSILADDMVRQALEQFAPAAVTGAAVLAVVVRFAPEAQWMLPGLWQIIFGLGVFAACRFLPKAMVFAAAWYVVTGLACLAFANGPLAFSPWAMGVPFAIGQLLVAGVLRFSVGGGRDEA